MPHPSYDLDELRRLAREQGEEEFLRSTIPVPVFYVEQLLNLPDSDRFLTNAGKTGESERVDCFYLLRKRTGNSNFTSMITVGRSGKNDLVVPGAGISKFHAYFMRIRDDWTLVDAGSSLGTFVEGRELSPRTERAPMSNGTRIRLGKSLVGTFLDPPGCLEFLASL